MFRGLTSVRNNNSPGTFGVMSVRNDNSWRGCACDRDDEEEEDIGEDVPQYGEDVPQYGSESFTRGCGRRGYSRRARSRALNHVVTTTVVVSVIIFAICLILFFGVSASRSSWRMFGGANDEIEEMVVPTTTDYLRQNDVDGSGVDLDTMLRSRRRGA